MSSQSTLSKGSIDAMQWLVRMGGTQFGNAEILAEVALDWPNAEHGADRSLSRSSPNSARVVRIEP